MAGDKEFFLTFGGGVNARRRTADVDINECVPPSENFDLDPQYRAFTRRPAFDLVATATNAGSINGFAQLIKQDGTISTLVQAGDTVYSWDGDQTFTSVGTVSSSAKLRGPREHNFTLDEIVIITDLEKQEVVKKWDGTTFQNFAHNLGGNLYAKYCRVHDERAIFANITTATATPHVILASQIGASETLTVVNRPSSSLSAADPWFLPSKDLRPVNGIAAAFGNIIFSTERGRLFRLTGSDATDYELKEYYVGSAVVGDEAIKDIGNDVMLGSQGRLESLISTDKFAEVEADDLSARIAPLIENVTAWTIEYDRRLQDVYCFPQNKSEIWVYHKKLATDPASEGLSPWGKWTTAHALGFQPTCVMALVHPVTGRDAVYMGDTTGNIYLLAGDGALDGGTNNITVKRRSALIELPEGDVWDIRGWITYRKLFEQTLTIRVLGGGKTVYEQEITKKIPAGDTEGIGFYNGDYYYNDSVDPVYYGVGFSGRVHRQDFSLAGNASVFQVELEIEASDEFIIEDLKLTFEASR